MNQFDDADKKVGPSEAFAKALDDYLDARADLAFAQFEPASGPTVKAALQEKREQLILAFNGGSAAQSSTPATVPDDERWWSPPDSFGKAWLTNGAALHPLTVNLVVRFARALAAKLAAAEVKYGYSDGWRDPSWMDECREKLAEHIAKGDPRDVAAYCAFLWHHGASTASPAPSVTESDAVDAATVLARLDALKDDAAAHIWPDDLEKCATSECVAEVYSVRMGSPSGKTVPLFSRAQVVEALRASTAAINKESQP